MNRPYTDFRNERLGKRIDYDRAYAYQCVDLAKLYLDKVVGLGKIGPLGDARDVPNNRFFAKGWEIIKGTNDLMQGDIIVRTKGQYGHIAIVDHIAGGKVYVLEQNGSGKNSGNGIGPNAIRVQPYSFSWYDTVLRCKKIFENLQAERAFVAEKVRKLQEEIRITNEYIATTRYQK
ncbi:MAG: CHAP domain-containing protein [Candidatus Absconditicoccaceae bacterium]